MQAVLRLAHVWAGHRDAAFAVCFHPNGDRLASCGADGLVCVWQPGFQQPIQRFTQYGQPTWLSAVAFHPQAEVLASASGDGRLWLWNTSTGRILDAWAGHAVEALALAYSGKGDLLVSGSADGIALVREASKGTQVARLHHPDTVGALAWSPNGQYLVTGAQDGQARLWSAAGGQFVATILQAAGWVNALAWSPNGRQVACGLETAQTILVELPSWLPSRVLEGHRGGVLSVAFSPDSQIIATGGADGTARLWEVATGRTIASTREHHQAVTGVALAAPPGQRDLFWLATASRDHLVHLWSVAVSV